MLCDADTVTRNRAALYKARRSVAGHREPAIEPLAIGEQATTVYADPREVKDPRRVALAAAKALGVDAEKLYPVLADRTNHFVYVKRKADPAKVAGERPDGVVFNGFASQYDHDHLPARVGERVRIWVLDAGPNRPSSFHVVGGQFDTVYAEGAWLLGGPDGPAQSSGAQSLALAAAQGGFVELAFPEAGRYPFVSHIMVDAERGAHGTVRVTDPPG